MTGCEEKGDYYRKQKYRSRHDCVYEESRGKKLRRWSDAKHSGFHETPGDLKRDVGNGGTQARVLLSERYVHLGKDALELTLETAPAMCDLLARLKQGHRVHALEEAHIEELERLRKKIQLGEKTRRLRSGGYIEAETRSCASTGGEACGSA